MAETLDIKATIVRREGKADVYVEWHVLNLGIEDQAHYGQTLPIDGSVTETIAAHESVARKEIATAIEALFPGEYR